MAVSPSFLSIMLAKLLHVGSSAVLGPAIAAITLGLVGHAAVGPRLGRNARFASIGNGLAAAVMGVCGYLISPQAVFYVTAALALPTLLALAQIREGEIDPIRADAGISPRIAEHPSAGILALLRDRSLITLAACVFLFHAANAAMLPLVGTEMTLQLGSVGKCADCGVHRRASAHRCDYRAWDRATGGFERTAACSVAGVRGSARTCSHPRVQQRSRHNRGSADARRLVCRSAGRSCAAVACRHFPGNRPLQSGAGDRRNCHGHRGGREHHFGGISRPSVRNAHCIPRLGEHCSLGFRHGPPGDAGNWANRDTE